MLKNELGRIPMTEKPILFSGEMVRAILEGRKTQTRRVVNPQPWMDATRCETYHDSRTGNTGVCFFQNNLAIGDANVLSPYGHSGDLLWVRETWAQLCEADELTGDCDVAYRADDWPEDEPGPDYIKGTWRPSIFMPRWASRITLELTGIIVERVQDITDDGAIEEGVNRANTSIPGYASTRFAKLWDSINAKRGFPWSSNPWVWVVSFRVVAPQHSFAADH